jgi:ATP-dependent Zn protease
MQITILFCLSLLILAPLNTTQSSNRPTPTTRESGSKPQSQSTDGAQQTKKQKTPAQETTTTPEPENTSQSDKKSADISKKSEEKTTTDWWLVIFTGVLALVAALQFVTFIWQVWTSKNTSEKELRAYVFPCSAKRFRNDGVMWIKIDFTNSGKTPAHDCVHWVAEIYPDGANPPAFVAPAAVPDQSKYALAPGNKTEMLMKATEPPREIHEFIVNNIRALYVYGEIHYRDVFNKRRRTRFRFVSGGANFELGTFAACKEGNDAT